MYSEQQVETEIARAEESIERATGQRSRGFRGPGFSLSPTILRVLARRGYLYDASTFPTFLGPLARAYYFMTSRLTPEERRKREALFGGFWEGVRPLTPYRWRTDAGELIEIPVTTMPIVRTPIHLSYILYLCGFSRALALRYFDSALRLCQWTGTPPSVLLHPLDFLGYDDMPDLSFFPAMRLATGKKIEVVCEILRLLSTRFTVLTLEKHAHEAARVSHLPVVEPTFRQPHDQHLPIATESHP